MEKTATKKKRPVLERFGKRLAELRKSKGFGQDTLTEKARLSRGNISRIESGSVDPQLTTLMKLADAMGVPLREIVSEEKAGG